MSQLFHFSWLEGEEMYNCITQKNNISSTRKKRKEDPKLFGGKEIAVGSFSIMIL